MSKQVLGIVVLTKPKKGYIRQNIFSIKGEAEYLEISLAKGRKLTLDLVPVHLKTESVSLKWLKKYCKKNKMTRYCSDRNIHGVINMDKLISDANKEAKQK